MTDQAKPYTIMSDESLAACVAMVEECDSHGSPNATVTLDWLNGALFTIQHERDCANIAESALSAAVARAEEAESRVAKLIAGCEADRIVWYEANAALRRANAILGEDVRRLSAALEEVADGTQ